MEISDSIYKKHLKGTTTVGIVCSDGIVLAADSRATMDTFIATQEAKKVHKIDVNLGLTIAGSVGDAQELIRIMKAQNEIYKMSENRPLSPKSASSLLSIILQQNKMYPYYIQLLVGGMDGAEPQLYNMDLVGGYTEESKFSATGSGSITALGYLEEAYKPGITTKEAIKMAHKAISIAIRRDAATGGSPIVATITKAGYAEYTSKDIEKLTVPGSK